MNDQTLLLRQVHPQFVQGGQLSSQAFVPFPKDVGRLSVHDGDQISAEQAYSHYTMTLGLQSAGVWAVTGGEVTSVELHYQPDPLPGNVAHAVIEFGARSDKACRRLAKLLRKFATDRDSLYRAA